MIPAKVINLLQKHRASSGRTRVAVCLLFTVFLFLVCTILILSSVPPVSRDALTHHLFVPRLYLEHGGIYEIPQIPFSYYPMNLDLLYMIPLYFGNDIVPKYIHFFFALLTAWLIYDYLKSRISKMYGLLGSLFFLSIPIIVKLSITVYVDLGLMFFTTASLLLLFRWIESGHKTRYLLLAGICCGLAAGTKYNGLVTLFLLSLFTPVLFIRSQQPKRPKSRHAIQFALYFAGTALLVYSPWLVRNYVWTGNPIYPLHNSFFQQSTTAPSSSRTNSNDPKGEQSSLTKKVVQLSPHGSSVFVTRKILYNETWWQALLLPVRFFFEGRDDDPRYFDGRLNPFLFLLPFFAFLKKTTRRERLEKNTLLIFALLFFFFTFFQEAMRIRYIVAIVPALVLLSIFGLRNISIFVLPKRFAMKNIGAERLALIITVAMLWYNGQYIMQQFQIVQPISYIRGDVSREQYISRFRPEYPAIQYANTHIDTKGKVLCLFLGNRGYYMQFQPVFKRPGKTIFFEHSLIQLDADSLRNELIRRDISHILLRTDLTTNWLQHLGQQRQQAVITFFQKETKKLFCSGGYSLYALR